MKKWFLKVLPFVAGLISGFDPEANVKLELSDEDKSKLDAESGQEGFAEAFMNYYNEEHLEAQEGANEAFREFMAAAAASEPDADDADDSADDADDDAAAEEIPEADAKTAAQKLNAVVKKANALLKTNAQLAADNKKLKTLPEEDTPEAVIQLNPNAKKQVKHSATHLFASGNSWDKLDRAWNKNLAESQKVGQIKGNTVWDKVNIDKLNEDLGAYSRRNSNEIMDMLMDGYSIPAHWGLINNIQDKFVFASIATGEITQGFKRTWLPKNKHRFVPIENTIFDKQIDITWAPSELKSIEKSWLNMFFNEGSTPYKMTFARYLWTELLKRARKEDKISIFKGAHFDTNKLPADVPGSFLNSMNGYLKLITQHRNVNYRAHDLAALTPSNTYDVIQDWCENKLPIDYKNLPDLKLQLGGDVHRWYVEGRESRKGLIQDYVKNGKTVEKFPNIEFVVVNQFEGTGHMDIQPGGNCGLMIDRAGEDSSMTIELAKREINVFADYKQGVYFKAFGAKVDPDAALDYEDQIFFSNNVELLVDTYVPIEANDVTPSVADHNAMAIGANNTAARDITKLDDTVVGQKYYLYGNSDLNVSTIKNNANIILDGGDFVLAKGNLLVVIGAAGDKVIEYTRHSAASLAASEVVALAADATTADANSGNHFVTVANTAATALTDIENALDGEVYTIEGGTTAAANATTIANGGNFFLTAAFTATAGAFLKVAYNGVKFVEVERG